MLKLTPPLKRAIYWGWDHQLKDLNDFNRCITQRFGENKRPIYKEWGMKGHSGIDIAHATETPILASHDGTITFSGLDGAGGIGIELRDVSGAFKTVYWHLKSWIYNVGTEVKRGQVIGYGDNTGMSTGDHLHWGLKYLDENGNTKDKDNGYFGGVDPMPYLVWFDQVTEITMLTLEEVMSLQAVEGYQDPQGAQYWVGKPLKEYLKARLPDKIKELQSANEKMVSK